MITGASLRRLRRKLGMGVVEFGRRLGYEEGSDNTVSVLVRRIERGERDARPEAVERARGLADLLPGNDGARWRETGR